MHLSKKVFYVGIIASAIATLLFWDWPAGVNSTGTMSLIFFGVMATDIAFAGAGFIRLVGPALFADDEGDDEFSIHEEDLHFSDNALFGLFTLNAVARTGYFAWLYSITTGAESFYYSLWALTGLVVAFFSVILWKHAVATQKKLARKAKQAQADNRFRQAG